MKTLWTLILILIGILDINAFVNKDSLYLYNLKQINFHYANDLYHGTDRYLTQLAFLNYTTAFNKKNSQSAYTIQQNVYTPSDIFGDTIQKNDRPYAGLLFATYERKNNAVKRQLIIHKQIDLGVLGKAASGYSTQREIHYAVNSRQPLGWQYQLSNSVYANATLGLDKGLVVKKYVEYIVHGQLQTGTVFNNLAAAQTIRVHFKNSFFSWKNNTKKNAFRVALQMKNELKYVAYNGTLQGGIGSKNNVYVLQQKDLTPTVYYRQIGLHLAFRHFGIAYSESFITKEFKSGVSHKWSSVNFSFLF